MNSNDFQKELERRWRQWDRDEDVAMEILASEMADPGSTGCDPKKGPPTLLLPDGNNPYTSNQ